MNNVTPTLTTTQRRRELAWLDAVWQQMITDVKTA